MNKLEMSADLRGPLNTWVSTATTMVPSGQSLPPRDKPVPGCQIVALLVAAGVSQQFDLTQTGLFGDSMYQAKFVRMISESAGNFHYAWSIQTGTAIDRTATGGATGVAAFWPSLTPLDELPAGQFLNIQAASAGIIRLWITNRTT